MTFPGINGDIRLLADIAAIDGKRNKDNEERALDLIAAYEHMRRNLRYKTGEPVFSDEVDKMEVDTNDEPTSQG